MIYIFRRDTISLECGGKRSATPLWPVTDGVGAVKAPSPLRSAGALHKRRESSCGLRLFLTGRQVKPFSLAHVVRRDMVGA